MMSFTFSAIFINQRRHCPPKKLAHKKAQLKARLNRPKALNTRGSHMVGLVRFELTTKGL
jgi:hypothetical protein